MRPSAAFDTYEETDPDPDDRHLSQRNRKQSAHSSHNSTLPNTKREQTQFGKTLVFTLLFRSVFIYVLLPL